MESAALQCLQILKRKSWLSFLAINVSSQYVHKHILNLSQRCQKLGKAIGNAGSSICILDKEKWPSLCILSPLMLSVTCTGMTTSPSLPGAVG